MLVRDAKFYKSLLLIALPAAFQNLISFGVNMLDNIMVGSLGEVSLSAVALSNQVSSQLLVFATGIASGASVLISQYWGKQDLSRIRQVFGIGLKLSVGVSALATLLILLFPQAVMSLFSSDLAVQAEAVRYLRIVALSYVLVSISTPLVAMLRCAEVVRISWIVSITSFFCNLILNYLLIFGKLGLPALGVAGAALATLITRILELALVWGYAFFRDKRLCLRPRDLFFHREERGLWQDFFRFGALIVLGDVLWSLVATIKTSFFGHMGSSVVSAVSITEVVMQLATVFVFGLASAACVIIGKTVGAKEYDKTRQYARTLQWLFLGVGILMGALAFSLRHAVPSLYAITPETARLASQCIAVGSLTVIGTSYAASCFVGINRGSGDGNFVVKTDLVCGWLIILPLTALSAFLWQLPPVMVFFFSKIDQLLKMGIATVRLSGDRWIRNVTRN